MFFPFDLEAKPLIASLALTFCSLEASLHTGAMQIEAKPLFESLVPSRFSDENIVFPIIIIRIMSLSNLHYEDDRGIVEIHFTIFDTSSYCRRLQPHPDLEFVLELTKHLPNVIVEDIIRSLDIIDSTERFFIRRFVKQGKLLSKRRK